MAMVRPPPEMSEIGLEDLLKLGLDAGRHRQGSRGG